MLEVKRIGIFKLVADPLIHGVDVCLVNSHAPFCKGGSIIYGDVMELRMVRPILIRPGLKQMQVLEHGPLEKWLSG